MMDTPTHINVSINDSIDDSVDNYANDCENDREKLLKPRNNFASYSNEDVNIRFRKDGNVSSQSIVDTVSNNLRRLNTEEILPGATNFLSSNYESLDYDPCENHLLQDEERKKGYKFVVKKNFARWFIFLLIGICTALIASFVNISIEELTKLKYGRLKFCILYFYYKQITNERKRNIISILLTMNNRYGSMCSKKLFMVTIFIMVSFKFCTCFNRCNFSILCGTCCSR